MLVNRFYLFINCIVHISIRETKCLSVYSHVESSSMLSRLGMNIKEAHSTTTDTEASDREKKV